MKTIKFDAAAPGIQEIDGQLTVLSAETANVEFGEFHSFKTGVGIQIPDGKVGLLVETQPMGARGVTLSGKLVTSLDLSELRVGMLNNSRNAFPVQTGMPIARLILLDETSETLEESSLDDWQKIVEEAKEKRNHEQEELHGASILNGPGKPGAVPQPKPTEDGSEKSAKAKEKAPEAATVNADAKAKAEGKTPLPSEIEKENNEKAEAEEKAEEQKKKENLKPIGAGAQGGSAGANTNTPVTGTTGGNSTVSGSTTSGGGQPTGGASTVGGK